MVQIDIFLICLLSTRYQICIVHHHDLNVDCRRQCGSFGAHTNCGPRCSAQVGGDIQEIGKFAQLLCQPGKSTAMIFDFSKLGNNR